MVSGTRVIKVSGKVAFSKWKNHFFQWLSKKSQKCSKLKKNYKILGDKGPASDGYNVKVPQAFQNLLKISSFSSKSVRFWSKYPQYGKGAKWPVISIFKSEWKVKWSVIQKLKIKWKRKWSVVHFWSKWVEKWLFLSGKTSNFKWPTHLVSSWI